MKSRRKFGRLVSRMRLVMQSTVVHFNQEHKSWTLELIALNMPLTMKVFLLKLHAKDESWKQRLC